LASQQYFQSVSSLISDLRKQRQRGDMPTVAHAGIWAGRYARKIDDLPILHVDDELLEYGRHVTTSLRHAESLLRGVGGQATVAQQSAPNQYRTYSRWGAYGPYYGSASLSVRDLGAEQEQDIAIRTAYNVEGLSQGRQIIEDLEQATADIRRRMTQKYQVEF
jgi:hypothetical protein